MAKELLTNISDILYNSFFSNSNKGAEATPIGTIIAFMGTTPPPAFIICDGRELKITEYLVLADYFKAQFGSINYFGGDGTATFAVPDLRNEFLRGYRGESVDQLSGDIGKHQDATRHITTISQANNNLADKWIGCYTNDTWSNEDNVDKSFDTSIAIHFARTTSVLSTSGFIRYSARPTNVAVLYCIKAENTPVIQTDYMFDTVPTVIGSWIGKPIYRQIIDLGTMDIPAGETRIAHNIQDIDMVINFELRYKRIAGEMNMGKFPYVRNTSSGQVHSSDIQATMTDIIIQTNVEWFSYHLYALMEYTKKEGN